MTWIVLMMSDSNLRMKISRAKKANVTALFSNAASLAANDSERAANCDEFTYSDYNTDSLDVTSNNYPDPKNFFKDISDESDMEALSINSVEDFVQNSSDEDPVSEALSINLIPGGAGNPEKSLLEGLNHWYLGNQSHSLNSYSQLLALLKKYHPELPVTAATALQSLKKATYQNMDNYVGDQGRYAYFGIVVRLTYIYEKSADFKNFIDQQESLSLLLSTDGVDLFSSSSTALNMWPVSFKIVSDKFNVPPITFAIFEGPSKPAQHYLIDLSHELAAISNNYIELGDRRLKIKIIGFTCDSPARCFCKFIKSSNAGQGCERCDCQAKKNSYVMCFGQFQNSNLRNDADFRNFAYRGHNKGVPTLLLVKSIDFIYDFFLDSLHLCDEGATKRFCGKLFGKGKRTSKIQLKRAQITQLEEKMLELKSFVSTDFQRPLVLVKYFSQWKACTFRDFVLYFGPLLLKSFMPDSLYQYFLKYCVALRILRSRRFCVDREKVELAQNLINEFVNDYDKIIGFKDTVYCVHSLIHLPQDVQRTKLPLDELSTYPFENSYRYLRGHVKSSTTPVAQIEKRLHEHDRYFPVFKLFHESPVIVKGRDGQIKLFQYLYFKITVLSRADCFCCLDDGTIVKVVSISEGSRDQEYKICVEPYHIVKPFFNNPIDSSIVGIYVVKLSNKKMVISHKRLRNKVYIFPYKTNQLVAFPAVHSL